MSKQLDQMIADAATKNLGFAQALETLADLELDSRNGRAIERRFRMSRLHAQHSIDSFHFKHHKSRMEAKNRIVRLLDLEFLQKGTSVVLIGNPGVGKTFLAKVIGWRACQANQRVLFTTAMDMLNHLNASQVDHSLVRKLRVYTEPALLIIDELGYLALDQQTSNLFYQVISTRHSQKRATRHYYKHSLLRMGQYPLQHDHRHRHRGSSGRELRDLPARRRQPPQSQEPSTLAG